MDSHEVTEETNKDTSDNGCSRVPRYTVIKPNDCPNGRPPHYSAKSQHFAECQAYFRAHSDSSIFITIMECIYNN